MSAKRWPSTVHSTSRTSASAGRLTAAIAEFGRVIEMAPDFAEGWNKRATAYYLNDELEASVADIQRTLVLEPRHFGALSGMGLIFLQSGDPRGALAAFEAWGIPGLADGNWLVKVDTDSVNGGTLSADPDTYYEVCDDVTDTDTITVEVTAAVGPAADAGPDVTVGDGDADGSETITLDGSASTAGDTAIVSYVWSVGGTQVATGLGSTGYVDTFPSDGTTYYYCAIAQNGVGTAFGGVLQLTTPAAPSVTTDPATGVTASGATIHSRRRPTRSGTRSSPKVRVA